MTGLSLINSEAAAEQIGLALGLPIECTNLVASNNALIAQSLRRAVFIEAPCNARNACSITMSALAPLIKDQTDFLERITNVLEDLIATGDILEMRREDADGPERLLRPAPPSFVKRADGTFILLGVAGDEITPIVGEKVAYRSSGLRTISPVDPTNCTSTLLDLGLIELTPNMWMHAPKAVTAREFLDGWLAQLPQQAHPEIVDGLELLDTFTPTKFYVGRWRQLRDTDNGVYLARRSQKYGAKLWSLIEVQTGVIQRLVDIHARDARIRDCDEAWRIQSAFDARAGAPQQVGVKMDDECTLLSFYSPLPAWAVRRLTMIGDPVKPQGALLGFRIPIQNVEDEIGWLEETLWLARNDRGAR